MMDISICCYVEDIENERLTQFFRQLLTIESVSNLNVETLSLVDDRSREDTFKTARIYSKAEPVHFENASQVKNLLLEKAKGRWILNAEPTMEYNISNLLYLMQIALRSDYKCIEAVQMVVNPHEDTRTNPDYTLIGNYPTIRFQGLAFETLRVFPHEMVRADVLIGTNHLERLGVRMEKARPLIERELEQLARTSDDAIELYWAAERYCELFLIGCFEEGDERIIPMYKRAIKLRPDFGPAYYGLAGYHLTMERQEEALNVARKGLSIARYDKCKEILEYFH